MLTPEETQAAHAFWKWFEENRLPFEFLEPMPEAQRQELYEKTRKAVAPYSTKVDLLPSISTSTEGPQFQMVIGANANAEYFDKARALAALAPSIPNWSVRALMPPIPRKVGMRYPFYSETLLPDDLWCALLGAPDNADFLGIRVFLRYYDHCPESRLEELRQLVAVMVGHALGEENWGNNVHYLDLASLPPDPLEEGLCNVFDLMEYIAEFRKDLGKEG